MNKDNTKRLIFWGILFLFFAFLTYVGITKYYDGCGESGRNRKILLPIIDAFNESDMVKKNAADIEAKLSNNTIIVTYDSSKVSEKYIFTYTKTANMNLLSVEYNAIDSISAEEVAKCMIEAVSTYNGNDQGELFKKYQYSNFYNTNTIQGVRLTKRTNIITLDINIYANVITNLIDVDLNPAEIKYITSTDLENLKKDLSKTNIFKYNKEKVSMYVTSNEYEIAIYCSDIDKKESTIYESIMSVINILNPNMYEEFYKDKVTFTEDVMTEKYAVDTIPEIDFEYNNMTSENTTKVIIAK